ncbi:hypothetical protein [Streptomyces lydicus]|uniref:hypothetical protein n=1 Tax=Streptomyces lydicus TaxID=47763 RepID=UPI00379EB223
MFEGFGVGQPYPPVAQCFGVGGHAAGCGGRRGGRRERTVGHVELLFGVTKQDRGGATDTSAPTVGVQQCGELAEPGAGVQARGGQAGFVAAGVQVAAQQSEDRLRVALDGVEGEAHV